MDEDLERLVASMISSVLDDDNENRGKFGYQEKRRQEILDLQKRNRRDNVDRSRTILDLVKEVEEINPDSIWHNDIYYRPRDYVPSFHNVPTLYNNILMMSEWMVEKPIDFEDNWYVVPCPQGSRVLVVANRGITKCYMKFGKFRFQEVTALPGGNPFEPKLMDKCCVLDCFYSSKDNTMHVLDILAWNNQTMTDTETEFRHFWLKTQLGTIENVKSINKKNKIIFSILPKVSCSTECFNEFMAVCPPFPGNKPNLDGLLFYHKHAHYFSGQTPLVGWLYPFMVPEVFGSKYKVNVLYMLNKPKNYVDQATYIVIFQENAEKKKARRGRRNSNRSNDDESMMDVAQGGSENTDLYRRR